MDRTPFRLLFALSAGLLAACSGSSNSPDPTSAPQAADDAFTSLTGRDQLLDVLANDRDPAGVVLTLVSVTGQGQAALAIDGNRVRYRPRCCDLSADEFRYTVRNTAGRTATAVVRTTVERRLVLRGTVADIGSTYSFRLFDGASASEPRRETTPEFTLDLPFRADAALLRVEARRTDAAGTVSTRDVLQSVVGDGATLAQAAGADGELSAGEWEPLRVASLTTAWLGRLREANAGEIPIDVGRLDVLRAQPIDVEEVLTRAQLIKTALDDAALALPVGDTFTLASSAAASAALLAMQPADYVTRDRAALFGPAARRALPTPPTTLWLYRGGFVQDEVAVRLDLAGDGTGRAIGAGSPAPITWSMSDGALKVQSANYRALVFGSTVLYGSICNGGHPIGRIEDRNLVRNFEVRGLALRADAALPTTALVDYEAIAVSGGSVSTCAPLFTPLSLRSGLGLIASDRPRGATLPEGPLGGSWILPRGLRTDVVDLRPQRAGRVMLDANRQGRGLFEEDAGVVNAQVVEGVLRLSSVAGEAQAYPVAGGEGAYRVVTAFPTPDGAGVVSEGWLVQEDANLRLVDLWRGRIMRDCCRLGEARGLTLNADGTFSGSDFTFAATRFELDGRRVVLQLTRSGFRSPLRIIFTALRRLPDGRVLMLTRFDDDLDNEIDDEWPVVDLVRFE